jgi:hypothetical protein
MNASDLKFHVTSAGFDSHFFTRETMRFFGDTMRNYGVRSVIVTCRSEKTGGAESVSAWELFRRKPVKHGVKGSAYFCKNTFRRVFPMNGE